MSQQVRLVSDRACPGRLLLLRLPDEDHHTDVRTYNDALFDNVRENVCNNSKKRKMS